MGYTNSTPNYKLPQWLPADKPSFANDINPALMTVDLGMQANKNLAEAANTNSEDAVTKAEQALEASHENAVAIGNIKNQVDSNTSTINAININSVKSLSATVSSGFGGENGFFIEGDGYSLLIWNVYGENNINISGTSASSYPDSGIDAGFYIYKEIDVGINNKANTSIGLNCAIGFNDNSPVLMNVIFGANGKIYYASKNQTLIANKGFYSTVCATIPG